MGLHSLICLRASAMSDAAEITRRAKSNLAFALAILPRDRRDDAVVFYAFCRVIDDLADDLSCPITERELALSNWREGLESGFQKPDALQQQVVEMRDRHAIPTGLLVAIVEGCRMDLKPLRFGTWEDLSSYTWHVACAVGLVAMRIFGARDPNCEKYAVALGHALQLTNIIRDVGEDLSNGVRIYLPLADLHRFQYTEKDLIGRVYDGRFRALMDFQAQRAESFYSEASQNLPPTDRKAMASAEIMHDIYRKLLLKIRRNGFQVFDCRYRLSRAQKVAIFSKHFISTAISR